MFYTVLDVQNQKLGSYNHIKHITTEIQLFKCTSDGRYLVYLTNDTQLYLTRLSDGKLLAWYTMYMKVSDLNISSDNWYVLLATQDRRLFMLMIADPDEREHDKTGNQPIYVMKKILKFKHLLNEKSEYGYDFLANLFFLRGKIFTKIK